MTERRWDGTVRLRNVATGEERDVPMDVWAGPDEDPDTDAYEFMWTKGNYSCDCNRALFWARAVEDDDPEDIPCGDERFRLVSPWEDV